VTVLLLLTPLSAIAGNSKPSAPILSTELIASNGKSGDQMGTAVAMNQDTIVMGMIVVKMVPTHIATTIAQAARSMFFSGLRPAGQMRSRSRNSPHQMEQGMTHLATR